MGKTSAAEAKLDARIRPEITLLRSRTSYPDRSRPAGDCASAQAAGTDADDVARPVSAKLLAALPAPVTARAREESAARQAAAAARQAGKPGPIRLTRRGRIVVGVLGFIVVAAAASLLWLAIAGQAQASSRVQSGQPGGHGMVRTIVRPGQTLWTIAEQVDPGADPRITIAQIVDDNELGGTTIQAGQVLWVPRS